MFEVSIMIGSVFMAILIHNILDFKKFLINLIDFNKINKKCVKITQFGGSVALLCFKIFMFSFFLWVS